MRSPYTPRQGQYLAFIAAYIRRYGQAPSEAEIATHFMVSPPSAHQMVVTLEQRGLIQRTPGQARSLRVLLPPTAIAELEDGRKRPQDGSTVEEKYPHIDRWIVNDGLVELEERTIAVPWLGLWTKMGSCGRARRATPLWMICCQISTRASQCGWRRTGRRSTAAPGQ